jgi:hypothetical protein
MTMHTSLIEETELTLVRKGVAINGVAFLDLHSGLEPS